MSSVVFDSSVLLAIAKSERHDASLLARIEAPVMSAVNFAEVISRFLDLSVELPPQEAIRAYSILRGIEPFTAEQAQTAGELRRLGKHVSLGDRACLALALHLGAEVYTADAAWATFEVGVKIHLVR